MIINFVGMQLFINDGANYYFTCILHGFCIIIGAVYISQLLNITHTLQYLNMSQNDIGDEGMAIISEVLQHNKSLTKLKVEECGLSVKGTVMCKMQLQLVRYSIQLKTLAGENFNKLLANCQSFLPQIYRALFYLWLI